MDDYAVRALVDDVRRDMYSIQDELKRNIWDLESDIRRLDNQISNLEDRLRIVEHDH